MSANTHLLRRLQDSLAEGLRSSRRHAKIGGLEAFLHPNDAMIYMNYAFPTAEPTRDDLQALVEHFQNNNRTPRFEYFPDLWPRLEPMLIDSGFTLEMHAPLMAMTKEDFVPRDPMGAKPIEDEAGYRAYFDAASEAFGMRETPTDESVAKSLSQIETGYMSYAGIFEGTQAVAGGCVVGAGPIVELAGVATRESHRRRGLASAASSLLCAHHFDRGGEIVWLSAGSDEARQVYAKLGFQLIGEQWNYSIPTD